VAPEANADLHITPPPCSSFTSTVTSIACSRRLEREAARNVEVMWLTCRLVPDHKTIADFRKNNGPAIKQVCAPID
jgi:transposase